MEARLPHGRKPQPLQTASLIVPEKCDYNVRLRVVTHKSWRASLKADKSFLQELKRYPDTGHLIFVPSKQNNKYMKQAPATLTKNVVAFNDLMSPSGL